MSAAEESPRRPRAWLWKAIGAAIAVLVVALLAVMWWWDYEPPQPDLQPTPSPGAGQVPVITPRLGGGQQLTEAEAARVAESIDAVPTTDPELAVDAGDPGAVALEADADPALVGRQRQALGRGVFDRHGVACGEQVAGHGQAHLADADDVDALAHCGLRLAARAMRAAASISVRMNWLNSAVLMG